MTAFVPGKHRIHDKYEQKYFYTIRINQITFTYGERKKEWPNFYGIFSQNLPISAAFTAILKMKLPQCDAIGVRTPPGQRYCSEIRTKIPYALSHDLFTETISTGFKLRDSVFMEMNILPYNTLTCRMQAI